jgi:voltage-gated potassium channel
MLVRALLRRRKRVVVIDRNQERINDLALSAMDFHIPGLCADASSAARLQSAGLSHPFCQGVVALTDHDEVNLKIAITVKLLNPSLPVICRAESRDTERNMRSFGTDQVINPFAIFGERLALALHSPGHHLLHQWLSSVPGNELPMPIYPPHGTWILCGFGRFGKAVHAGLQREGVTTVIVEEDPERAGCAGECIRGRGTEADTLEEAGVHTAAGIVAGTDRDSNNLSILMTAHELNPELFMVARQNRDDNSALFEAGHPHLVVRHSEILAETVLAQLTSPLLPQFLAKTQDREEDWVNELLSRISAVTDERVPAVWNVELNPHTAPAWLERLRNESLSLGQLLTHPVQRDQQIPCVALLLQRRAGGETLLTPGDDTSLEPGDKILFSGQPSAIARIFRVLRNPHVLDFLLTGRDRPQGWLWRRFGSRSA